jgi:ribose transport system substrate-binding protein
MHKILNWRTALVIALVGATAILLAACGGGGSSSSSSSGSETTAATEETGESTTAGAEESEGGGKEIVPAPPNEPVNEFPITTPIKETPPPHQDVIWLACELTSCQGGLSEGYEKAAKALGWGYEKITYNTLKVSEGVQQAVNKEPDSMFISGIPEAAFESQWKEAKQKGIKIFSGIESIEPEPEKNDIYYEYFNTIGYQTEAKQVADWMINDSEGKAKVATVVIEEYPTLVSEVEGIESEFKEHCPECSIERIPVTVEDVGAGKIPSEVTAYLQSHPEIDYVEYTVGGLQIGVAQALESAGIEAGAEGVKFTGMAAESATVKELAEGKLAAWAAQPFKFLGWISMDAAVRAAEGEPLDPYEKSGLIPTWMMDNPESAQKVVEEGGEWAGPENYEEKFEELWGVK